MPLAEWFPLFIICFLGAASPGPSLAVVLRNTTNGSRLHGIVTALGHCCGFGLYALAATTGLAVLIVESPVLFRTLTWIGAAYLVWLGYKAFRASALSVPLPGTEETFTTSHMSLTGAAREGFLIAFLNPKIALFFLALFSQFVEPGKGAVYQSIMAITAMAVDGLWYTLVATVFSHPRLLPKLQEKNRLINQVTGCVFILIAARIFIA